MTSHDRPAAPAEATMPQRARTARLVGGLVLALALALVVVGELSFRAAQRAVGELGDETTVRQHLFELQAALVDAETGQRGFLLTGQPQYLQPYTDALARLQRAVERLQRDLAGDPAQAARLQALLGLVGGKLSELETTLALHREGREEAWRALLVTGIGRERMEEIRAAARTLIDEASARIDAGRDEISRTLWLARIGIAGISALLVAGLVRHLRLSAALDAARRERQQALQGERDRLERLVAQRTAELSELADHLQRTREDERSRLARELHDELGALLTAAKFDLARLKSKLPQRPPEIDERIEHLGRALDEGIALKRRIIEDLRPSALDNLGLTSALGILAREFAARSGIAVETRFEDAALAPADELTVYRIVQEALTNVAKHAGARHVRIALRAVPGGGAEVEVEDDGRGFDAARPRAGAHGLLGMRHRVQAAGGRFDVQAAAGTGARLSAWLPPPAAPAGSGAAT